ncbi:MAG: hypothetical protein ACI9KS_001074 [Sulfitobacter sp.]|jgi:hypothetical protein
MFKTLSAAALSLTIGLTSFGASATPAQANDDIAKFIFGAIVLGVIANGINQANAGDDSAPVTTTTTTQHRPRVIRQQNRGVRIPARCERQVRINNRNRNVFVERCLRRNDVPLRRISTCARSGSIRGRNMTYYPKACLRRNGHRV